MEKVEFKNNINFIGNLYSFKARVFTIIPYTRIIYVKTITLKICLGKSYLLYTPSTASALPLPHHHLILTPSQYHLPPTIRHGTSTAGCAMSCQCRGWCMDRAVVGGLLRRRRSSKQVGISRHSMKVHVEAVIQGASHSDMP